LPTNCLYREDVGLWKQVLKHDPDTDMEANRLEAIVKILKAALNQGPVKYWLPSLLLLVATDTECRMFPAQ